MKNKTLKQMFFEPTLFSCIRTMGFRTGKLYYKFYREALRRGIWTLPNPNDLDRVGAHFTAGILRSVHRDVQLKMEGKPHCFASFSRISESSRAENECYSCPHQIDCNKMSL